MHREFKFFKQNYNIPVSHFDCETDEFTMYQYYSNGMLHRIPFVWEPRDIIEGNYVINVYAGPINNFSRYYEETRVHLLSIDSHFYLPQYPRIRKFVFDTDEILNYDYDAQRFMNPNFFNQNEFLLIHYKEYYR